MGSLVAASLGFVAVAAAAGLCIFTAVYFMLAVPRAAQLRNRLEPHVAALEPGIRGRQRPSGAGLLRSLFDATERSFGDRDWWQRLDLLLERAGLSLEPAQFLYASIAAGLVLGLLGAVAALPAFVILLFMLLGGLAPYAFVSIKATRRMRTLEAQLPDVLTTLAALLKAGHSLRHGMQTIAEDSQPPISTEFSRALSEMELGLSIDDALQQMGKRVGSAEFDFVISAITIQREVGGSLANFFDLISEIVRDRQQFGQKIRALTATGRLSGYLLLSLPILVTILLTLENRDYMDSLYHTSTGHILVVIAVVLMTSGTLILRKIIAFKG